MPTPPDLYYRNQRVTNNQSTVWQEWVVSGTITSSNSTAVTFADTVWHEWNTATTSSIQVTYRVPDSIWVGEGQQMVATYDRALSLAPQLTDEERQARSAARDAATAQERARREEAVAARQVAAAKAEELLTSCLDQEQQVELETFGRFHVMSSAGRRFCIHRGRAGNVRSGDGATSYCIHDAEGLPEADTMLAQKLLLETDEAHFLLVANASPRY